MIKPRCCAGYDAIVIKAQNPQNIGRIVKVVRRHVPGRSNGSELSMHGDELIWDICAPLPMAWEVNGRLQWRTAGPVPDRQLWPIREDLVERPIYVKDWLIDRK
jgi:hypothetical protein